MNKIKKPVVDIPENIDYDWISGFFSGEGCFYINIYKSKTHKVGYDIITQIILNQHSRDKLLINKLIDILGCGNIYTHSKDVVIIVIYNFKNINEKMIPLFNQYKIRGVKYLDFEDFCKATEIVKRRDHLKIEGLEQIKLIKSRMNKARYLSIK